MANNPNSKRARKFIKEYAKDRSGTKAALRAGYAPGRAGITASELLRIPIIKEQVEAELKAHLDAIGVNAHRVLTEITRVAMSDTRKLFRDDGTLKPPLEWDDETAAAVSGVEALEEYSGKGEERTLTGHTKKVRLWDKNRSLEMLAKHLKLIVDVREDKHTFPDGIPLIPLSEEAEKRVAAMIQVLLAGEKQTLLPE